MASGSVTRQQSNLRPLLIQNKDNFILNFEVHEALPKLYRENIISAAQYQRITSVSDRTVQRTRVFDILVQKTENGWEEPFRRILEETNQIHLIEDLDRIARFGQTVPNNNDLAVRVFAYPSIEDHMLHQLSSREEIVEEAMANDVLDIRPGTSICIHVRGVDNTEETIMKKMSLLVKKAEIPDDETIEIEVYKMEPNSFFDEYFPKTTPVLPDVPCSRCLRKTILHYEEFILGQIESDVIDETLKSSANVSAYIKNVCSSKNQPRVVRAKRFLMYVLQNRNILHTFFKVCKKMGLFDPKILECTECTNADTKPTRSPDVEEKIPFLRFTANSSGEISIIKKKEEEFTKFRGHKNKIPY